jgi:hypothetical protein
VVLLAQSVQSVQLVL